MGNKEDQEDVEAAKKAIEEAKQKGHNPVPWEKVKKDLGL